MIALKIITIVFQLLIAIMVGFAIGACIALNKKYDRTIDLLTKAAINCGDILELSGQIANTNKSLIKHLDLNIDFIRQNMIRRKKPIVD